MTVNIINSVSNDTNSHIIAPTLLSKTHVVDTEEGETTAREQSESPLPIQNKKRISKSQVRNVDIIKYLMGTIAGKDKISKLLKSLLDIVKKVCLILPQYSQYIDTKRISAISTQLSLFRCIMRFGSTPYSIANLIKRIVSSGNILKSPQVIFSRLLLEDSINVYSTVFDELSLLGKLNIIKNRRFRHVISRNDTWATEVDAIYSLKKACCNYKTTQSSKFDNKAKLMNKIDVARFTLELVSNTPDLFLIKSRRLERLLSLLSSVCSAVSAILNIVRLWIMAKDQLSEKLSKSA
ncbi:hypothetical protein C6P45_002287 [Maudiozyma exigua]|uniref:Uncharacterized protein n=1 Tax=Maudiozyma exigua TaxID=34358 RepID=A0A9P7B3U1_MAUEX|nr:hypothetical protein C6P45_002287 [Kazachstania exigua]